MVALEVSSGAPLSAPEALVRARMAMQSGDVAGAMAITDAARRDHPDDAALADAAGDLALRSGDAAAAAAHFAAACRAAPTMLDYALNHAIALQRMDQHREALAVLEPHEKAGYSVARYGSIRALSERSLGHAGDAARWYDAALTAEPHHPRALHGRARVALERGEGDAVARFDAALAVNSGDADLWLGKAQALEVAGDIAGARTIAEQIAAQAPGFIAALEFLSGMKLAAGDADFAAPFRTAADKLPQDPNIPAGHAETLAGLDHAREAAEIAAAARSRFPNEPHFALLEAVHAGSAGEWERAEAIFATLPTDSAMRALHEARHRLRAGDTARAEALLERALVDNAWDISAWALRGICWRLADDDRAGWLHEQQGLVQLRPLAGRDGLIGDAVSELRRLHAGSALPLGQSLRGGTQTRGILFQRTEPLLAELHAAIRATLEDYRRELAPLDQHHPLLRHRETAWQLAGSWSVRLTGGGDYHTAHIHPQGIVSSALYLVVPEEAHHEGQRGWLEVGRPPPDLGLDLPPLRVIEPQEGHLALFPSTLYHGTTAFGSEERMTVAFDVVTGQGHSR
ncbi:putative 2OG-Fe(II) oxygenase [Erythrobacter sp. JK5]|uniref:putative 2OG-Fe(II) oxygenase n=1 Tax=Erythrobacter sp. JK5 TaxID=2829500 RepID=UPI001BAC544B|nr:putative 2OG-Fe(II) oxygenase [Erythrobacter sp. JK5]QUL36608.1 tetratricopeptide repeat protein [Erythrobacter sp. JK5]